MTKLIPAEKASEYLDLQHTRRRLSDSLQVFLSNEPGYLAFCDDNGICGFDYRNEPIAVDENICKFLKEYIGSRIGDLDGLIEEMEVDSDLS